MARTVKEQKQESREDEQRIQRQLAFAAGLFRENITLRTFLESLTEGIIVIDRSGIILHVNDRAEEMFGYERNKLIGSPHALLIPERFRKLHEEHESNYFQAPRRRPMGQLLNLTGLRADGSELPVEISLNYLKTTSGILVMAFISDISLRKEYESRLEESEKLFHTQLECVKDYAIHMLDTLGMVLNWNAGAERLLGYGANEVMGRHFSLFYTKEDRNAGDPEKQTKIALNEGRVEVQGWRVRRDGACFWADVVITPFQDENGNPQGFSVVTHDITERRQILEALRLSEARYRALYQDNPTMIVTIGSDLRIETANPFCTRQLGYGIDELVGLPILSIFHEDDRSGVEAQLRGCLQNPGQVFRWQYRKLRKDGGLLWVEEIAQAIHDLKGNLNVLVVCQDITERRQVEEALKKSERKFSKTFHSAPALIGITTLKEGKIIDMNEAVLETLGYRRDEVIGKTVHEINLWENEASRDRVLRILKKKGSVKNLEIRFRGKSGQTFVGLFSAELIDLNGDRYMLSLVRDITERKQAEEEIRRLNKNLLKRASELEKSNQDLSILKIELEARAAELEAVNQELEAFNYSVAHDLRRPLTVINGYCQVIRELCGDKLGEQCSYYLKETYEGTLRMNDLIDALLNFSKMARVEPGRELVDLTALAKEVTGDLRLAEPGRRVIVQIAEKITVIGDSMLLRVVLDNLLSNAWKYTATREEGVIEFGAVSMKGKTTYFVRDNGLGFAKKDAEKLFIPFHRLPGSERFKGFGIGLPTVERIIRRHGGRIWAEGEPEEGATFYFTLPQKEGETA